MSRPLRSQLAVSEPLAVILLLVLAIACSALLFAQDRLSWPRELPSLTLPAAGVQRVLRADAEAARAAPQSPSAEAMHALLLEHGRIEAQGPEEAQRYHDRRRTLSQRYREFVAEVGATAALRLREQSLTKLEAALALELKEDMARAVLGSFPAVLAREGASRDGVLVAPHFVVRTLYKARWNLLHGLSRDHGFVAIEERAYYGWQALHAERVPLLQRIEALAAYGRAGGDHVEEALGVLLLRQPDPPAAARAFENAYRKHGGLRLRNAVLGAREAARPPD